MSCRPERSEGPNRRLQRHEILRCAQDDNAHHHHTNCHAERREESPCLFFLHYSGEVLQNNIILNFIYLKPSL